MKIGVLALQGAFVEHIRMLRELGLDAPEVRLPQEILGLSGLIIPGGESTAIGKLMVSYGLIDPVRRFAQDHAVWGTCAGMILMAKNMGRNQVGLGMMDIIVERNAFGRQIDSFEEKLTVDVLKDGRQRPFPGIFIRAPRLVAAHGSAQVIASLADGTAVAARQNRWLATAFHPELSNDLRFHQYFIDLACS
ncbi:MAG: pyridoxal 5'-phosphate synthase glutaminase subunit PdxT [Desulfobacterales bacterium]|jgi:5'-phosphate synthase pdxT subunit